MADEFTQVSSFEAPSLQEGGAPDEADGGALPPDLLAILVCPVTRGELVHDRRRGELISRAAGLAYPVRDGVPIMLESEARVISRDEL